MMFGSPETARLRFVWIDATRYRLRQATTQTGPGFTIRPVYIGGTQGGGLGHGNVVASKPPCQFEKLPRNRSKTDSNAVLEAAIF